MKKKIFIYLASEKVGEFVHDHEEESWNLAYSPYWIKNGFPLSPPFLFNSTPSSRSIRWFLENLFPEGQALEELLNELHISQRDTLAILESIGRDTAGALTFTSMDENVKGSNEFRILTKEELIYRLDRREEEGLIVWDGRPRLSLAGVQDKLAITILPDKSMGFGEGDLASTHIFKFQKKNINVFHLALNEYFCMKLAKECGLDVPEVEFLILGDHRVFKIERFDRKLISFEKVERRHMIDACQALDLPSSYKYEINRGAGRDVRHIRDGVSFEKVFDFCLKCDNPAQEKLKILDWVIFNLLISNFDSHGKNISYFIDKRGITLAPFYDLVCIGVYPKLDHTLAMCFGEEFLVENVREFELREFAQESTIPLRLLKDRFEKMMKNFSEKLDVIPAPKNINDRESLFLSELKVLIGENVVKFREIIRGV